MNFLSKTELLPCETFLKEPLLWAARTATEAQVDEVFDESFLRYLEDWRMDFLLVDFLEILGVLFLLVFFWGGLFGLFF